MQHELDLRLSELASLRGRAGVGSDRKEEKSAPSSASSLERSPGVHAYSAQKAKEEREGPRPFDGRLLPQSPAPKEAKQPRSPIPRDTTQIKQVIDRTLRKKYKIEQTEASFLSLTLDKNEVFKVSAMNYLSILTTLADPLIKELQEKADNEAEIVQWLARKEENVKAEFRGKREDDIGGPAVEIVDDDEFNLRDSLVEMRPSELGVESIIARPEALVVSKKP